MQLATNRLSRRTFMEKAAGAVVTGSIIGVGSAKASPAKSIRLFDGSTLDGWLQTVNGATSLSASQITDPAAFITNLTNGSDPFSVFLRAPLDPETTANLKNYAASDADAKAAVSALVTNLNRIIAGPPIYDHARFDKGIVLRPETLKLLKETPHGQQLARLNKLLVEDAYPAAITPSASVGWVVRDGVMASLGTGRGVIYTAGDYSRYRLLYNVRHVSGHPDHQAGVLFFCKRPGPDEAPLDALGGIQFQLPMGSYWDYRPGNNNSGSQFFKTLTKSPFDRHAWSQVELLVDAGKGTARLAVAQPPGSKAIELVDFSDPSAGRTGPIAFQMHNAGLFDEYREITLDPDPKADELITVS